MASEFHVEDLDAAEVELLTIACRARDVAAACEKVIDEEGPVAETAAGNRKSNPAVGAWRDAVSLQLRAMQQLGIPLPAEQPRESGRFAVVR